MAASAGFRIAVKLRLLLALLPGVVAAQSYDFSELDRLLERSIPAVGSGLAVTMIQNGQVIYRKSFGQYAADPTVPIASASKWYSGALTMAAVDEGRLSLDDTLGKFFPGLPADKASITVRQLWSHTSGIAGREGAESACLSRTDISLAECAAQILALPLAYPPGAAFSYGGDSMQVGGRVVEIATGKRWTDYWREKIAVPLGFTCTAWSENNPRVAGGAASCMADYVKFLTMIANRGVFEGRRVLSPQAVFEMQQDQTRGAPIAYSPYQPYESLRPGAARTRYGIGEWLEKQEPSGAPMQLGSQGAFGFSPWLDLRRNLAGVVSMLSVLSRWQPTYFAMRDVVERIVPEAQVTPLSITSAASYRGGAVAPGEILAIFGSGIGPHSLVGGSVANGRVGLAAGETRVLFDGEPAPVLYASAGQTGAVAPFGLALKAAVRVEVEYQGRRTLPVIVPVEDTRPAVFTANAAGSGPAAALNEDGSRNSPANPAPRGSVAVLYLTGGGPTNPPPPDGAVAEAARELAARVQVFVAGAEAAVLYAGAAPGLVAGAVQVNLRVPANTPAGNVPVVVRVGGRDSQPGVTVAVR